MRKIVLVSYPSVLYWCVCFFNYKNVFFKNNFLNS